MSEYFHRTNLLRLEIQSLEKSKIDYSGFVWQLFTPGLTEANFKHFHTCGLQLSYGDVNVGVLVMLGLG